MAEQGEIIFARYGNPLLARRHIESVAAATLLNSAPSVERLNTETTERYAELKQKTSTDVGSYFDSLLQDMSGEERALIASALQKLDAALERAEGKER